MSPRLKWLVAILIVVVLGLVGIGTYYILSNRSSISASTAETNLTEYYSMKVVGETYALIPPGVSGLAQAYLTAGQSNQRLYVRLKDVDDNAITSVQFYPYVQSSTCNIIGRSVCFEISQTPINITYSVSESSFDNIQVVTIEDMPEYNEINAVTFAQILGSAGYTAPTEPVDISKSLAMYITNEAGDKIQVSGYFRNGNYINVAQPPANATNTIEIAAGKSVSFCDESRNIEGNTMKCDVFVDYGELGYARMTPIPWSDGAYFAGMVGGECDRYDGQLGHCISATVSALKGGTYRILNTDYQVKVTDEDEDAMPTPNFNLPDEEDNTTACGADEYEYVYTPNKWNLKTNFFTPSDTNVKLSDYLNGIIGNTAVKTYAYDGATNTYVTNPTLSTVTPGIGYWLKGTADSPICIPATEASAVISTSVTIPSTVSIMGNPTASEINMSDIEFTYNGSTMSLAEAGSQSTPLVRAIFVFSPTENAYISYYASIYTSNIAAGGHDMGELVDQKLAPGEGFWLVLSSKVTGAQLKY